MRHYDIVLVLDYFRSATGYLSIIKHLAERFSIGLYVTPMDPDVQKKNRNAHELFITECLRLGAQRVGESPVSAGLMVVQQRPYPEEIAQEILRCVRAVRRVGYLTLAMSGLPPHDAFLRQFTIEKVYVPNRRLFDFLLTRRNAREVYRDIEVEQVGLPFAKYPLYPDFAADYLIASPTVFSFRIEAHKHQFLETILRLFEQIGPEATVVYKPHNGAYRDYFTPRAYSAFGRLLAHVPSARRLLSCAMRFSPARLRQPWEKLYSALLHSLVLRRVVPMGNITPCAEFSLEAFLPGVRKGVIGGLSNTIWGTLYFGLPYYNCVDVERRKEQAVNTLLGKDSSGLLDLNLEFFGVPYCAGDIHAGAWGKGILDDEDRCGDLIETLLSDIAIAKSMAVHGDKDAGLQVLQKERESSRHG
jgi:hypothetical protein